MANFYGKDRDVDFAASKLMSFGKSFSRMNGQPLDESEVWYDKAALEAFAAGNSAYVGMKLVYVDETNQKVYQYSVQYDGSIKEIGVAPLGDSKSIVVDAETGTVSLKGINSLVFEREIEGGEKEDVQYQPLMTKNGLVWVEPSKTTVEGLATLIEALTARVKANEDAIGVASKPETTEGAGDGVAATGLHKKIEDEVARALAAEAVLDGKIAAIDFVDADELATALEPYAKTADVNTELNKKAEKTALEALEDRVDAFLTGTGTEEALDSLQELIKYINEHDDVELADIIADVEALQEKVDTGDKKVSEYVIAAIEALKIGDYAKAADLTALAGRVATLEGKVDVDKVSEAIGAAEGRAATDATNKANAVRTYVGEFTTGEDNYKDLTSVVAYINKKAEETLAAAQGGSSETAASVKLQLDNYKTENDAKVKANTEKLATIEENAQVNVIESVVKANDDVKLVITKEGKTVKIDDSSLVSLISAAQTKADQGVADAAAAAAAASAAQGTANQGVSDAAAAQSTANTAKSIADQNKADIAAHATEFATLKGRVDAHDTAISGKAEQTALDAIAQTVGTNTGDITTLKGNVETINSALDNRYTKGEVNAIIGTPAEGKTLVEMIADAQKAATYNDEEVRTLIGNNTTAIENITKADGAIALAVKAEADRATGVESGLDNRLKEVETFFAAVETPDETINTLAEIVSYIESDKSGAAELTGKVNKNTTDIGALTDRVLANETAISTTLPNAIAAAIKETEDCADAEIAKVNVLATIEAIAGEDDVVTKTAKKGLILPEVDKFEMTDGKVTAISTDLLKNGSMTLVLNGGTAKG